MPTLTTLRFEWETTSRVAPRPTSALRRDQQFLARLCRGRQCVQAVLRALECSTRSSASILQAVQCSDIAMEAIGNHSTSCSDMVNLWLLLYRHRLTHNLLIPNILHRTKQHRRQIHPPSPPPTTVTASFPSSVGRSTKYPRSSHSCPPIYATGLGSIRRISNHR